MENYCFELHFQSFKDLHCKTTLIKYNFQIFLRPFVLFIFSWTYIAGRNRQEFRYLIYWTVIRRSGGDEPLLRFFVPKARLELASRVWRQILSLLCIPFHHFGIFSLGEKDLNLRPPRYQRGVLTKLNYRPILRVMSEIRTHVYVPHKHAPQPLGHHHHIF